MHDGTTEASRWSENSCISSLLTVGSDCSVGGGVYYMQPVNITSMYLYLSR